MQGIGLGVGNTTQNIKKGPQRGIKSLFIFTKLYLETIVINATKSVQITNALNKL